MTTAAACDTLVGEDRLVQRASKFPRRDESDEDRAERVEVQEGLSAAVVAGHETLADPAGQFADFLDDPEAYHENGTFSPLVITTFSAIWETCDVP
jgi:hypothetical protein